MWPVEQAAVITAVVGGNRDWTAVNQLRPAVGLVLIEASRQQRPASIALSLLTSHFSLPPPFPNDDSPLAVWHVIYSTAVALI